MRGPAFVIAFLLLVPQEGPPLYPDKADLLVVRDAEGRERPVRTLEDWAIRRGHILRNFQRVAGPFPDASRRVPLDPKVLEERKFDRFVRKKITFAVEKNDRVPAYLFLPKEVEGKAPAMLCLHQTTRIGKGQPAGMGNPNLKYAVELAERGFVTLAPDYPNFGGYKIDVYARGYVSATMKGIWNHMRGVDFLQSLPEVDGKRIGTIGHSLGGHNSIFVAVFDRRIKAVVSSCGFNAFPKYYGGNLRGWSHKGYMPRIADVYGKDPAKMPFDFPELAGALAPRPFFINAPLRDANFEVSGVRDCVKAARPVYELLGDATALVAVYPDAAHEFPPGIRRQAYAFLEKALGAK